MTMDRQERDAPLPHHAVTQLAPQVIALFQRHAHEPAMAAFAPEVLPLAAQMVDDMTLLAARKSECSVALATSAQETATLHRSVKVWRPVLAARIGNLPETDWALRADAPEHLHKIASDLLICGAEHVGEAAHLRAMHAELERQLEVARQAYKAGQDARITLQMTQREVRARIRAFHRHLVLLRRIVHTVLGPKHPDYRALVLPRRRAVSPTQDA
jgi:hypothetical protein